jgi:flagellar biosynthetic protein FliQ
MNAEFAIELLKTMIYQGLMIAAPLLATAMVVGLAVSLFQAVTSINEQTMTFVPKALAVIAVLLVLLPWIVRTMVEFTIAVIQKMPEMVR